MLRLQCEITIGELFFDFVHEVHIKSSWKNLTDTCTIKLPRKLKTKDDLRIDEVVKSGDEVLVKLGYYEYGITERFKGYVTIVNADTPIAEVQCEDEMWKLKQTNITKSWKSATVEDVIKTLKSESGATWQYNILGDNIQIGQVKFENMSAAKCLMKLKDDYGQICFFRKGKLTVGKPYDPDASNRSKRQFEYGRNVINWKDLKFRRKDETKIQVRVVNHKPDGSSEEIKVGDDTGEQRTLDFYDRSKTELKKEAEAMLDTLKFDGYRGKIPAFLEPEVKHGDTADIADKRYAEREGEYWIDAVDTDFFPTRGRQTIELGPKV